MKVSAGMVIGAIVMLLASASVFADRRLPQPNDSSCAVEFGQAMAACLTQPAGLPREDRHTLELVCIQDAQTAFSTCVNRGPTCRTKCKDEFETESNACSADLRKDYYACMAAGGKAVKECLYEVGGRSLRCDQYADDKRNACISACPQ